MLDETFGFGFAFGLCVRCTATRIACNNSGVQPEGLCAEPSCLRSFSGMDVTLCLLPVRISLNIIGVGFG